MSVFLEILVWEGKGEFEMQQRQETAAAICKCKFSSVEHVPTAEEKDYVCVCVWREESIGMFMRHSEEKESVCESVELVGRGSRLNMQMKTHLVLIIWVLHSKSVNFFSYGYYKKMK